MPLQRELDDRFKAAVPVYGCGFLFEGESVQKPSIDKLGDLKALVSQEVVRLGMLEDHETILSQGYLCAENPCIPPIFGFFTLRWLRAKGYGPDKPIADNKSTGGRQKNRRVEIEVIGTRK